MTAAVRVLVVDDHVFYREGIKVLLGTRPDEVVVVGEAATGEEAVDRVAELEVDVVLMDLQMPGAGGIVATRRLRETAPGVAVLVLTMLDDDSVVPALSAGARGYLLKDAGVDDLVRAITAVHHGQSVLAPQAAGRVHRRLLRPATSAARPFPELTEREHDLLAGILDGLSNRQIAHRLGLSDKTVRNYTANILAKLQARDRAELVERARSSGYPG